MIRPNRPTHRDAVGLHHGRVHLGESVNEELELVLHPVLLEPDGEVGTKTSSVGVSMYIIMT